MLEHLFAKDEEVPFYNVPIQNPLAGFVNLRIHSTGKKTLLSSAAGQETICEKGLHRFVPAVGKAIQALGWDNAEDRPSRKGFPDKQSETPRLADWLGVKLRAF
jgi:hypothetical protein